MRGPVYLESVPRRCLVYTLLLVSVINAPFVLYAANYILVRVSALASAPHEHTYTDADQFPAQLPIDLPTIHVPLQSGAPRFSLHADDDWSTLFPASDGFTDLDLFLPATKAGTEARTGRGTVPVTRTFLVSMVHQLHCLDVFRVGFATNRTGYAHHVEHCLRYMLQIVLCNADATLEADEPGYRNGRWEHAAGGVGSVHECRDWTVLRNYLDEHPAGPVQVAA